MFSFFKTPYYLSEIIPNNYTDIHNHLLPGIDDGAKSVEQTSLLIAEMQALNISNAIATPHTFVEYWNNTPATIKSAFEIATKNPENKTFLKGYASEYMLDATLMNRIKNEKLLCIRENYLLLEFPLFNNPIDLYEMLFELKIKNYKIILAHPERYLYLHNSLKKFEKLKDFGLLFQLNILSVTGYYGKEIQKKTAILLENDMYDFTGTDIHSNSHIEHFKKVAIPNEMKNKFGDLLPNNAIFNEDEGF